MALSAPDASAEDKWMSRYEWMYKWMAEMESKKWRDAARVRSLVCHIPVCRVTGCTGQPLTCHHGK